MIAPKCNLQSEYHNLVRHAGKPVITLIRPDGRKWQQKWATSSTITWDSPHYPGAPAAVFNCISRYRNKPFYIGSAICTAPRSEQKVPLTIYRSMYLYSGDQLHLDIAPILNYPWAVKGDR
jgi:hypothetical protein